MKCNMNQKHWDLYAPLYNLFMKKDEKAYQRMYALIRESTAGKDVLELATGTGLIANHIADSANHITATDYSEKMIAEAKKSQQHSNVCFEIADACELQYEKAMFDAVIISNALHIIPQPEKVIAEIQRVLKPSGMLIAPTFVHGKMNVPARMLSKMMSLVGFRAENKWTADTYASFLRENGCVIKRQIILDASFPLAYMECIIK